MTLQTIINRQQTCCKKWDALQDTFGIQDVLPMWIADMDFPISESITKALQERLHHPIFGYTVVPDSLKNVICTWSTRKYNWDINKNSLAFTNGVVPGIASVILGFTKPMDKIVIQPPVYAPFSQLIHTNNRTLVANPLQLKNNRYEIDFDQLETVLQDAKLFILCNPHNPSGRIWTREELEKIGELCLKHQVLLVSDEIHCDLMLFGNTHIPMASISEEIANNTITFMSPSKTFNIAGLHFSYAIIPNQQILTQFNATLARQGQDGYNAMGLVASEAAYSHGKTWLANLLVVLEDNTNTTLSFIEKELPHITAIKPEASYLIWVDCRSIGNEAVLREKLLQKNGVAPDFGLKYGVEGDGFIRLNVACPEATLQEGLRRLAVALR